MALSQTKGQRCDVQPSGQQLWKAVLVLSPGQHRTISVSRGNVDKQRDVDNEIEKDIKKPLSTS